MVKDSNPVKDPAFQKALKNLLNALPKPHSEMKVGKKAKAKKAVKKDAAK